MPAKLPEASVHIPGPEHRARLIGDSLGDLPRAAIDRLEIAFAADHPEFLSMRVVGERLDDVGARMHEVAMELSHDLGMLEHDLRHESPGLEIASPLELEDVALGADHGTVLEALQQGTSREVGSITHGGGVERG